MTSHFRTHGVRAALVAAAVFLVTTTPGCDSGLDDETFDKISTGMTVDQVEGILGAGEREDVGGVSISGAGVAGGSPSQSTTKTFSWKSGGKQIVVEFKDEKVVSKRKIGF